MKQASSNSISLVGRGRSGVVCPKAIKKQKSAKMAREGSGGGGGTLSQLPKSINFYPEAAAAVAELTRSEKEMERGGEG